MTSPQLARLVAYGVAAIIACALLLLPLSARATGSKPSNPPTVTNPSSASSQSNSAAQAESRANAAAFSSANAEGGKGGMGGSGMGYGYGGAGGSIASGDFYVLPAPISGSNLPAGICQRSQYRHLSIGWNFYSHANGDSFTDQSCLDAILAVQKARYEAANPPRLPPMTACERKQYKAVVAKKKPRVCK